ncbi:MAG: threonine/serine exporter family protein [Acidobacteriota bacterium]
MLFALAATQRPSSVPAPWKATSPLRPSLDSPQALSLREVEALVEKVGVALHAYGCSSPRLEATLSELTARLGAEGHFFSTPTAIFAAIGSGEERKTLLLRTEPGEVNLDKLSRLNRVLDRLFAGELAVNTAARRVDRILAAPSRYSTRAMIVSFALTSACAAHFFGGSLLDFLLAGLLGLGIGLLTLTLGWVGKRLPTAPRMFETASGLFTAAAAFALAQLGLELQVPTVLLASLIVLVPGFTVTVAMHELAMRHLVSGSARLAGAILVFLTMGFGVALGSGLGQSVPASSLLAMDASSTLLTSSLATLFGGWAWAADGLALAGAAVGFTVLFGAAPKDGPWILGAATLALLGSRGGAAALGPELGAAAGALAVGLAGNAFARTLGRPSTVLQIPGLMLLVPGSVGFRGVSSLLEQDALAGVQGAFTMILLAAALVAGLLMANVLLPPRRSL